MARTLLLTACLLLAACSDSLQFNDPQPKYSTHKTPCGTTVYIPEPLWKYPEKLPLILQEVDSTSPPAEWTVRVRAPYFFLPNAPMSDGSTKPMWVRGLTRHKQKTIEIGWQFPGETLFLPALAWEVSLARLPYEQALNRDLDARFGSPP
jgi:hypothetical protein